ncbi:MAG: hypothetical protein QGG36_06175, partial [Pirellulaceae bacterium]|nr:hypothetical protein [Pirellulaceae bacterium]
MKRSVIAMSFLLGIWGSTYFAPTHAQVDEGAFQCDVCPILDHGHQQQYGSPLCHSHSSPQEPSVPELAADVSEPNSAEADARDDSYGEDYSYEDASVDAVVAVGEEANVADESESVEDDVYSYEDEYSYDEDYSYEDADLTEADEVGEDAVATDDETAPVDDDIYSYEDEYGYDEDYSNEDSDLT